MLTRKTRELIDDLTSVRDELIATHAEGAIAYGLMDVPDEEREDAARAAIDTTADTFYDSCEALREAWGANLRRGCSPPLSAAVAVDLAITCLVGLEVALAAATGLADHELSRAEQRHEEGTEPDRIDEVTEDYCSGRGCGTVEEARQLLKEGLRKELGL